MKFGRFSLRQVRTGVCEGLNRFSKTDWVAAMTAYKFLRQVGTIVVLGLTLALLALPAAAVTVTWDPNGDQHTDSGGTWTTSAGATNWYTGTGDTAWTNGGTLAAFGWGTGQTNPYTVTLGSAITAGGLVFNNQNYTIAGGGNTLTLSAAPTITVNAASAAISATIAGAASSLTKSGAGTLVLTSFNGNAYSGGLALNGGTLQFGDGVNSSNVAYGGAMSGANTLVIASNSTFTLSSGNYNQLANNVVVNGDLSSSSGRANTLQNATVTLNGGTLDGGGGDPTYGTLLFYSQGQIVANGAGNVIQGAASASSPTIGLAAAVTLNTPQPGDALTISAGIGHPYGNGTLTKNGSGSVFVTGNLSAGNTVNVNAGLFSLSGANSLTWVVSVNGGTLAIAGGSTTLGSNYIVMGNAGAAANKPYFVQTGGSFSTNGQTMYLGNATGNGMSTVNVSGGTFTSGQLWLGVRAPTTVNISSSASVRHPMSTRRASAEPASSIWATA
jgi:autotransporter-associated beta strand protein